MSGPIDSDSPEFKAWAVKRLAEIRLLEEDQRRAEESPPDELKEIFRVVDYEVAPILDASGVPITREELDRMFAEWFVRRKAAQAQDVQAAAAPVLEAEDSGPSPVYTFFADLRARRFGRPIRRVMRLVGIGIMLVPLVFVPAYFFLSVQIPPPLASGVVTLSPANPLIAPGQTQNYTVLTVSEPPSKPAVPATLTAYTPPGLSFDIPQSNASPQTTTLVALAIHASMAIAPGPYQVTVELREGSAVRNQTFTVTVVPALVVMEHLSFVPQFLNVTKGTTVYWMNLDSTIGCCDPGNHNVAFRVGMNMTSPTLKRLDTWSFTFDTPGRFFYYCSIHPFMAAAVNVAA